MDLIKQVLLPECGREHRFATCPLPTFVTDPLHVAVLQMAIRARQDRCNSCLLVATTAIVEYRRIAEMLVRVAVDGAMLVSDREGYVAQPDNLPEDAAEFGVAVAKMIDVCATVVTSLEGTGPVASQATGKRGGRKAKQRRRATGLVS